MVHCSERVIKLISEVENVDVLTVEDYLKWYDLYVIKDNSVFPVFSVLKNDKVLSDIMLNNWFDHCISPAGFIAVAKHLHLKVGFSTYEAVVRMYVINYINCDEGEDPSFNYDHLPSACDLYSVLIADSGKYTHKYFN